MALRWCSHHYRVVLSLICLYQIALAFGTPSPHPTLAPQKPTTTCGMYGQPPCAFVPAPPGTVPKCASPGSTFCETNPDYPAYLIKQLVEALGFHRIIANEEQMDFGTLKPPMAEDEEHMHHHYHHFYGSFSQVEQPKHRVVDNHQPGQGYNYSRPSQQGKGNFADFKHGPALVPQPIYIPKPQHSYLYNSYAKPPSFNVRPAAGYFYPSPPAQGSTTPYSPAEWLKRFARDLSDRNRREARLAALRRVDEIQDPAETEPSPFRPARLLNETSYEQALLGKVRARRETAAELREPLCSVREKYVSPQTALNTKGNWMFVVNQENTRQLVKTEVCMSTACSNLCNFPIGYRSRCEQRYVQKRLVTLDPSGRTLYVDTYWFPSCCVCSLYSGN